MMSEGEGVAAVVVAAGTGERLRATLKGAAPRKAFFPLAGRPLIRWTLAALRRCPRIDERVVVLHAEDLADAETCERLRAWGATALVAGGARRQDSVLAGIAACSGGDERLVAVHDAARPLVSAEDLERVCAAAAKDGAAILAGRARDTVKRSDGEGNIQETLPREQLWLAQTPQVARRGALQAAIVAAGDVTDEAMALERAGVKVSLVEARSPNLKLTVAEDAELMARYLPRPPKLAMRVGQGSDFHSLVVGRPLKIGGVTVPFEKGSLGHSDGDVVLHALVDALLGAIGGGDIGTLFPDTDPSLAGADSRMFVAEALRRVGAAGYRPGQVDMTIHAEKPKLAPFKAAIRASIAGSLGLAERAVNVKAKTREGLGAIGRQEAIAAEVIVTVVADE